MLELNCREFTELLASKEAVPGGGGASALVAALGTALGNMVGNLTLGKKKYAEVEGDILALNAKAEKVREELLALVEADAEAFAPLAKAYSIPKDDPSREAVIEAALDAAAAVPLEIMRKACEALELISQYAQQGSAIAISDAGCGATLCVSALESAALNVLINTKSMKNRDKAEALNEQVKAMLLKYRALGRAIYEEVSGRLN